MSTQAEAVKDSFANDIAQAADPARAVESGADTMTVRYTAVEWNFEHEHALGTIRKCRNHFNAESDRAAAAQSGINVSGEAVI